MHNGHLLQRGKPPQRSVLQINTDSIFLFFVYVLCWLVWVRLLSNHRIFDIFLFLYLDVDTLLSFQRQN